MITIVFSLLQSCPKTTKLTNQSQCLCYVIQFFSSSPGSVRTDLCAICVIHRTCTMGNVLFSIIICRIINTITSNTSVIQKESNGCTQLEISFNRQFIMPTDTDVKTLSMVLDTVGFWAKRALIKYMCSHLSWVKNDKGCLRAFVLN